MKKKFAFALFAAFCFPVLGLSGCGDGGSTQVIEAQDEEPEISEAEQEEFDAAMDSDAQQ